MVSFLLLPLQIQASENASTAEVPETLASEGPETAKNDCVKDAINVPGKATVGNPYENGSINCGTDSYSLNSRATCSTSEQTGEVIPLLTFTTQ